MQLTSLIARLQPRSVYGSQADRAVTGIAFDSRKVREGNLFVAVRGTQVDGHDYLRQALEKGASVIVGEDAGAVKTAFDSKSGVVPGVCFLTVDDSAEALALSSALYYEDPSHELTLVGVTGTNGKTTVTTLLHDLFTGMGYKCGLLSTVEIRVGEEIMTATHTTPDAVGINARLADMVTAGCTYAFMEVSSHAVDQRRTAALRFAGGVFTNLSHDHLDYHKTFRAYLEAKKAFFDGLPKAAFALANADDKNGPVMLQNTAATKRRYSLRKLVDYRAKVLDNSPQGLHLQIEGTEVYTRLLGRFNAYNLLAAYAVARELDVDAEETLVALSRLRAPSGRLEHVPDPAGSLTAIVDYAHTPDALGNVLETLESIRKPGTGIVCVVGAGGDRDRSKRPEMARIAAGATRWSILTTDNPRSEDPADILADMVEGLKSIPHRTRTLVIQDRRSAIERAVELAMPGDIVLVAGKGHETYQEVKGVKHPFDDREVLAEALKTRTHVN